MKLFWARPLPKRCDCDFDIEALPVFSVERLRGKTCVGVNWGPHAPNGEWFLDCTEEKHNDLVQRFRAKLAKKDCA